MRTYRQNPVRQSCAIAFVVFALLANAGARAQSNSSSDYTVRMGTSGRARGPSLTLQGSWPTRCSPSFEGLTIEGMDIRLDARNVLGQCASDPTAFSIEVDPAAAAGVAQLPTGVFHVSFFAANGAQATPVLRAFTMIDNSVANLPATRPENGFWWPSGSDGGNGRAVMNFELHDNQVTVALMSYDSDGRSSWQFGTGKMEKRTAHVSLFSLSGGSGIFSDVAAKPRGDAGFTLDLDFSSSSDALAWLTRPAGSPDDPRIELRQMNLVRLPLGAGKFGAGSSWQGDWVLVSDIASETPQRVHFERVQLRDPGYFTLRDDAAGLTLYCERATLNEERPPQSCSVRRNDGTEVGQLDDVGVDKMSGRRADGVSWHWLRVSP